MLKHRLSSRFCSIRYIKKQNLTNYRVIREILKRLQVIWSYARNTNERGSSVNSCGVWVTGESAFDFQMGQRAFLKSQLLNKFWSHTLCYLRSTAVKATETWCYPSLNTVNWERLELYLHKKATFVPLSVSQIPIIYFFRIISMICIPISLFFILYYFWVFNFCPV